jgi:hypothetical protein
MIKEAYEVLLLDDKTCTSTIQGEEMMSEEQKPPVSSPSGSPPYNDAFLESLAVVLVNVMFNAVIFKEKRSVLF